MRGGGTLKENMGVGAFEVSACQMPGLRDRSKNEGSKGGVVMASRGGEDL